MEAAAAAGTTSTRPPTSPAAAFTQVVSTAVEFATAKASATAEDWTSRLTAVADGHGAKQQAGARAAQASLRGKNPVWAAIKGLWAGGSNQVKAAIVAAVVALVLLLVLSPVLLLVFLLSLLVVAAVAKVRSARR
jgi:hypothetical protein